LRIKFHGTGLALHDRLKILRNALGMTAAELAKASGVPASHISLIESGMEQTPSPHVLSMIAKGLGLTVADLTSR
jgi:transcriptional regulator with XRE-family HTH domain